MYILDLKIKDGTNGFIPIKESIYITEDTGLSQYLIDNSCFSEHTEISFNNERMELHEFKAYCLRYENEIYNLLSSKSKAEGENIEILVPSYIDLELRKIIKIEHCRGITSAVGVKTIRDLCDIAYWNFNFDVCSLFDLFKRGIDVFYFNIWHTDRNKMLKITLLDRHKYNILLGKRNLL